MNSNSKQDFHVGDFVKYELVTGRRCFGIVVPLAREPHGGCPVKFRSSNVAVRLTTGSTFYLNKGDVELLARAQQ